MQRNKKLIILIGLFIVVALLLVAFLVMGKKREPVPPTVPTATPTKSASGVVTPTGQTVLPTGMITPEGGFTGDSGDNDLPEPQRSQANKAFELRSKLPIDNQSFLLDFDYVEAKFVVFLKEPVGESADIFAKWLKDNGYDSIPQDQFIPGSY